MRGAIGVVLAVTGSLVIPGPAAQAEEAGETVEWRLRLEAWRLGIEGIAEAGGEASGVALAFDDAASENGFGLAVSVRKGAWSLAGEVLQAEASIEEQRRLAGVNVDLTASLAALKLGYSVLPVTAGGSDEAPARHRLDIQAGLRWVDSEFEALLAFGLLPPGSVPPELLLQVRDDWADLVVGGAYEGRLSQRLVLEVVADVGGFGIGSSSRWSWDAALRLGVITSGHWTISVGYRGLSWDRPERSDNSTADTGLELTLHGPVLAIRYGS